MNGAAHKIRSNGVVQVKREFGLPPTLSDIRFIRRASQLRRRMNCRDKWDFMTLIHRNMAEPVASNVDVFRAERQ